MATGDRIPIRDDFFEGDLADLESVRLKGTRCRACGEVFLGARLACESCQSTDLEGIPLSRSGTLWSFTINRYKPPGDYAGPDPYEAVAVGWIELPEGLRILSPLTGFDLDVVRSGVDVELVVEPLHTDADGNEVISYKFGPPRDGQTGEPS
jgi:uncharacterized OB-fold protein